MQTYDIFFLLKNTFQFVGLIFIGLLLSSSHIKGKPSKGDKKSIKALNYFKYLLSFIYIINAIVGLLALLLVFFKESSLSLNVKILDVDYSLLLLPAWHSAMGILYLLLSFSHLLYYRFKPDYRLTFIKRSIYIISLVYLTDIFLSVYLLNQSIQSLLIPELNLNNPGSGVSAMTFKADMIVALGSFFILFLAGHIYFRKKRTGFSAVSLLVIYLPFYIFLISGLVHLLSDYFFLQSASIKVLSIFSSQYFYIGLLLIFIAVISIYSLFMTVFITLKNNQFIARQFASGYSVYLARINFWSSFFLFVLVNLPLAYKAFFHYLF